MFLFNSCPCKNTHVLLNLSEDVSYLRGKIERQANDAKPEFLNIHHRLVIKSISSFSLLTYTWVFWTIVLIQRYFSVSSYRLKT